MNQYPQDAGDMPVEGANETISESDGLEIALPENADTYRLLMGEEPESNPKVETFREAYDRSMMESDDHSLCMEAGRKALEGEGGGGGMMGKKAGVMSKGMGSGMNPLNMG